MPWHIGSSAKCPASKPYAVIKDADGSVAGCHATKAGAQAQLGALYAKEPQMNSEHGDREVRILGLDELEIRHSGRKDEAFTVRGYAAVYDQTSHDLGGFREQIAQGAFDQVLSTEPDVHFVWDHDTRYVGARTKNNTLHLESDSHGLFMDAQVGNYSWAKDLRTALERGDINQGSFSFTVGEGGDEFVSEDDGSVMRTIRQVGGLYDVTVTAQGAYPQTSLAAVRSLAAVTGRPAMEAAPVEGRQESQEGSEGSEGDLEQLRRQAFSKKIAARRKTLADYAERLEKMR